MPNRKRKPTPKDSGGKTLLLLFGVLIGLAIVVRLFIGDPGYTGGAPAEALPEVEITQPVEEKPSFWDRIFGKKEAPRETEPSLPEETEPYAVSTATVGAMGDVLMHIQLISGKYDSIADLGDGNYDFSPIFKYMGDTVSGLDYAIANLETTFGGDKHPYQGNPAFNCPDQLATALKQTGFDMMLTANNHCSDTLTAGIKRTLDVVRREGLATLGTRLTGDEPRYTLVEVNGIRIGMVCYSYTMSMVNGVPSLNGGLPLEEPELVNWFTYDDLPGFYTEIDTVQRGMRAAGADATMVYIHWGEEYQLTENNYQRTIGQKLCDLGFDVIVGGHPHVVQPMALLESSQDPGHKTVCIYSLGNAVSNQRLGNLNSIKTAHTEDGVLFTVTFEKLSDGTTHLTGTDVLPLWVTMHTASGKLEYNILPLENTEESQWQTRFSLSGEQLKAAQASYTRTMEIVGLGLQQCRNWAAQNRIQTADAA